jgi:Phospholipase_D-nuclease N-terminal
MNLGGLEIIIVMIISLAAFAFWIMTIIDIAKSEFKGSNDKVIWLIVTILLGVLGALIYHFVGKQSKR